VAASAAFADPVTCGEGTCDAVFLTAASGVIGFASLRAPVPGIVIVQVIPSTIENGELVTVAEPTLLGCTYDVDVAIARNLTSGSVATAGQVPLRDFVTHDDGSFDCVTPNGHSFALTAAFAGVGDVFASASRSQFATPWTHELSSESGVSRAATVQATITLDGAAMTSHVWPGTASLAGVAARSMVVNHTHPVGPPANGPLVVAPRGVLVTYGQGTAGDWSVDAMAFTQDGTQLKTFLGVFGTLDGQPVWGDAPSAVVDLAPDLSGGTAQATVVLYQPTSEGAVEVGEVAVTATWTGTGSAWRFSSKGASSPDGRFHSVTTGIHRDAAFTLVIDSGPTLAGSGFLEAWTTKQAPQPE